MAKDYEEEDKMDLMQLPDEYQNDPQGRDK
jgi:hypothetical protein